MLSWLPAAASEADGIPVMPRVRVTDGRLQQRVDEGAARSPTLRALLDALRDSNVIVHICARIPDGDSRIGGSLQFVSTRGGHRYLRVRVTRDLVDAQLIALIAHELHHAFEVALAPEVTDAASMEMLYRKIGYPRGTHRHETEAALATEELVLRELLTAIR